MMMTHVVKELPCLNNNNKFYLARAKTTAPEDREWYMCIHTCMYACIETYI